MTSVTRDRGRLYEAIVDLGRAFERKLVGWRDAAEKAHRKDDPWFNPTPWGSMPPRVWHRYMKHSNIVINKTVDRLMRRKNFSAEDAHSFLAENSEDKTQYITATVRLGNRIVAQFPKDLVANRLREMKGH